MMPGQGAYYQQSPHPQAHHPQQYLQPQPHHPPPHHPHHPLPHAHPHHAAMQTPQRPPPSQRQPGPTPTGHYMQMGTPAGSSGAGPSSAKRARTTPSAASMSGAGPSNALIGAQDAPEDEEDTSRGDLFDHIPARDISTHRYKQHHEWFEEVFTSPYGSSDITPGSIGLEQLGEWIKPLIDGLLDKEGNPAAGKSYNETLRAVAERARAENAKIKAQMDEMERIHTRRLEEFHAGRLLLDADKELRSAILNEQLTPLGFTLPEADFDTISNPRPIADIIADVESKSGIKIVEFNEQNGARCWNIQPEVVAYEEAQAREAAAAAAAAHVVATTSGNTPSGASGKGSNEMEKDNAMAGVAASESTSPDNARYLVPVVIEKADTNTGSSSSSAHLPPNATIAAPRAATDHDTVMSDAEPLSNNLPGAPAAANAPIPPALHAAAAAAAGGAGTPASNPMSPFGIPSPSTAGFTPQNPSGTVTPSIPTSLPPLTELGKPLTPGAQQQAAPMPMPMPTPVLPGARSEEPPTVPGEDEVPDGFTGGDEDDELDLDSFAGGGAAGEALDLLGDVSFADDFE